MKYKPVCFEPSPKPHGLVRSSCLPLNCRIMPEPTPKPAWTLHTPLTELPGMTETRVRALRRLDLHYIIDLMRHYPRRYEYEHEETTVDQLVVGGKGTTRGILTGVQWIPGGRVRFGGKGRQGRFQATLEDDHGKMYLVWFNAGYLRDKLNAGAAIRVSGDVKTYLNNKQMINPKWSWLNEDQLENDEPAQAKLRPIYPATEQLSSAIIEQLVGQVLPQVLPQLPEPLPAEMLKSHVLPTLADAYRMIHQPQDEDETKSARRRLAFNELFLLQLGIALKRAFVRDRLEAPSLDLSDTMHQHILERFPFELTTAQQRVISEIANDLRKSTPMNRLLQGDVGAGKTVIALYTALSAVAHRKQAAMMAPTELLAEQHYHCLSRMLEGSNVQLGLLTGNVTGPDRNALLRRIAEGQVDLVIGTHALLADKVRFKELAVMVIDEQHRFGVSQRAAFRRGDGETTDNPMTGAKVPHHLVMTATPIPRTLSLTIFGDLDVSRLDELPPGRTPVVNRLVAPDKRQDVYRYVATRLERGEQAYIVVPAIDSQGDETEKVLKNVREHARELQEHYFSDYRVAAVHGRLKSQTREHIMHRFRAGQVHVLVATTVIEVGVDVPNASVMVIEHAERFGLAQLHQLRGRVGRSSDGRRSLCAFIAEPTTENAEQRMNAIVSTNDGFQIAEFDLEIRGMGEFFGTRQSGLPPMRLARIPEDMDLLQLAKRDAIAMVKDDPALRHEKYKLLRTVLMQQYGEALGLVDVG